MQLSVNVLSRYSQVGDVSTAESTNVRCGPNLAVYVYTHGILVFPFFYPHRPRFFGVVPV